MKTQRILAPVDGSERSHSALMEADAMASENGGELTLMFVHAPATVHLMDDEYPEPTEMTEELMTKARMILEKWSASLNTQNAKRHIVVERGNPAQTIIDNSEDYDMIVMSTHGYDGIKHFQLGSVTERVVRGAKCDVLVVKRLGNASD